MGNLRREVFSALMLAVLLGVGQSACANEAADKAAVEGVAQSWIKAFNAHDADALMALSTPDVALMDSSAPAPVSGSDTVRHVLAETFPRVQTEATSETKEISVMGDVAWRTGTLYHRLDGNIVSSAPSLEIYRRVKGAWKLHRQMAAGLLVQPRLFRKPNPKEPILQSPR